MSEKHYAVMQLGCGCLGVGTSVDSANADASEYGCDRPGVLARSEHGHNNGDVIVIECTERYFDAVRKNGGNIEYVISDGIVDVSEKYRILKALADGTYEITHDEECGCSIGWEIRGEELICDVDTDCCWEGNILYVDGEAIAEYIRYEGLRVLSDDIDADDIDEEIVDQMQISDMVERGESANNDAHEAKAKAALIDFLTDQIAAGARLYRDNERGFANEFTSIIVRADSDVEPGDDWEEQSPEEWADDYYYSGDAATESYTSVSVF